MSTASGGGDGKSCPASTGDSAGSKPAFSNGRLAVVVATAQVRQRKTSSMRRRVLAAAFALALLALPAATHAALPRPPALDTPHPQQLAPETTAVISADGDCLRLREEPGLNAKPIRCLEHGTRVQVADGFTSADGFDWQLVIHNSEIGWVAAMYVVAEGDGAPPPPPPSAVPPSGSGSSTVSTPNLAAGTITGSVPGTGGLALVVWGGGTLEQLNAAAGPYGCGVASAWATQSGGGLVGYIMGAPPQVNGAWRAQYGEALSAGAPVILVCRAIEPTAPPPPPPTVAFVDPPGSLRPSPVVPVAAGSVPPPAVAAAPPVLRVETQGPAIEALAAIIVDADSGAVLYEHNSRQPLPPASLTKIATAVLAIELGNLDDQVTVDVDSRKMPGSSIMGLRPGDQFTLRDLVYGVMLPSGNDAAVAVARHIAGTDEAFVSLMNGLMWRLGLSGTAFTDPHGLGGPGHAATAYDLAMLARYAMSIPEFAQIAGTRSYTANGSNLIEMRNSNRLMSDYPSADGVKNGFTESAGRTLVASATRDGHRVFLVLMNAPDSYKDAADLFDWVFTVYGWSSATAAASIE